ncbi:MAG: M12 family metallo-peptidase [Phycisphaerae bacterium]
MRRHATALLISLTFALVDSAIGADPAQEIAVAPDGTWSVLSAVPSSVEAMTPWVRPNQYAVASTNWDMLMGVLAQAPSEDKVAAADSQFVVSLPMPDGSFARFRVVDSPIMAPALAAQFPEIRTFLGQGIDDPAASVRFDYTPVGFHSQILSPNGSVYIDPISQGDRNVHAVYFKRDLTNIHAADWHCDGPVIDDVAERLAANPELRGGGVSARSGPTRREYRLACAATGEYTAFHGGTVTAGQAAIVTAINRVTGVYELEVAVRLILVANNSLLVYTNSATDPYTNNNGSTMLGQNQTNVDTVIGTANYDIGHVFSTGGGGIAGLGVVCRAGNKARGVTGLPSPIGDPFYIDFVAHEMGHQYGGNHSFNGNTTNCGSNRNASTAYEPGSGSTIMCYAGVCDAADNLQNNSDAYFHSISFDEIINYTTVGLGNGCPVQVATGNVAPTVNAGVDYTIPSGTPFALTATASDPNGDPLTYCWEERDLGPAQPASGAGSADNGTSPIQRSFNASTSPTRLVPRLLTLQTGAFAIGEQYAATNRTLNYRITARDNRAGGGGVNTDDMRITVVNTGSAFQVTSPNTNVLWSGTQTVTWNVANTTAAPISCALVNILLSTDAGVTYPFTLAANTANDGSEVVTIPSVSSTTARIKVESVGNIFFDISNVNFRTTIAPPTNVQASPAAICVGESTSLSATVDPVLETVEWFTGSCGGTLVGTGNPLVVNPTATTTYNARRRIIASGATSATCATVTVTVDPVPVPPTFVTTDRPNLGCAPTGTLNLFALLGQGGALRWYTGSCGGTLLGSGTQLTIPVPTTTTTYYARWESVCGASTCGSVTVTVDEAPLITQDPQNQAACTGGSATFNVSATGTGLSYEWRKGGLPIGGAPNAPSYTISPLATTDAGVYSVRVFNTCGSVVSADATLTVNTGPQGDLNGDGSVNEADLGILLGAWQSGPGGDIDGDGNTTEADLGILLANWQLSCP